MNEIMARSLTVPELAERLRYHEDAGVAQLASSVAEGNLDGVEVVNEEIMIAEERAAEAERKCVRAEELLRDCLDEMSDIDTQAVRDLVKRIDEFL